MKGMLIKDFRLLNLQKKFLIIVLIVVTVPALINGSFEFSVGFLTAVVPMFALSSISYDEFEGGDAFLFTLPISRKEYAEEKYLFALILSVLAWVLSFILSFTVNSIRGYIPLNELMASEIMIMPGSLFLSAITIPIQLKYGKEKGGMAIAPVMGIIAVLFLLLYKGSKLLDFDFSLWLKDIFASGMVKPAIVVWILGIIVFLISMKISFRIMEKKEF